METKVCGVKITNAEKVVYKKLGVKKIDVINYYSDISDKILKHIKGRPLTAFRCHGGLNDCFFVKHPAESDDVEKVCIEGQDYFYISNKRQLIFAAQMGTLEFHPWGCKCDRLEKPDRMIFDLDPAEDVSLLALRKATQNLVSLIKDIGLFPWLKTSGGKGYHVMVDIKKALSWEEFSNLSHQIAELAEQKWPNVFTLNMRKVERKGKIFLDYLRNKKGASCVAAYSLRAREGGTLSWPIEQDQLYKITPSEVNILNYKNYL